MTTINYNSNDLNFNDKNSALPFNVYLSLASRGSSPDNLKVNRIGLLCSSVSISTAKTVPAFPIPFSGTITGESTTLALDLGMASKTISLGGVIHDQYITKSWTTGSGNNKKTSTPAQYRFTAFELAQLIHSYVDSSGIQTDQSINELTILIPSRISSDFDYFTATGGTSEDLPIDQLPLIPFTFHNRDKDMKNTISIGVSKDFPEPISNAKEQQGVKGFVSSFSSEFAGEAFPEVTFTLEFTEAFVVGD